MKTKCPECDGYGENGRLHGDHDDPWRDLVLCRVCQGLGKVGLFTRVWLTLRNWADRMLACPYPELNPPAKPDPCQPHAWRVADDPRFLRCMVCGLQAPRAPDESSPELPEKRHVH